MVYFGVTISLSPVPTLLTPSIPLPTSPVTVHQSPSQLPELLWKPFLPLMIIIIFGARWLKESIYQREHYKGGHIFTHEDVHFNLKILAQSAGGRFIFIFPQWRVTRNPLKGNDSNTQLVGVGNWLLEFNVQQLLRAKRLPALNWSTAVAGWKYALRLIYFLILNS